MEFVELRSYDNYIPANLVLQRLEDEGIRAYLKDEHTVTMNPVWTNAVGGIKLMVFRDQAERALSLLKEYERVYRESFLCPRCESRDVHLIPGSSTTNSITAIFTWLFGNYAIAPKQVYKCYSCGNEFEEIAGGSD